jgi:hypothetical protein
VIAFVAGAALGVSSLIALTVVGLWLCYDVKPAPCVRRAPPELPSERAERRRKIEASLGDECASIMGESGAAQYTKMQTQYDAMYDEIVRVRKARAQRMVARRMACQRAVDAARARLRAVR